MNKKDSLNFLQSCIDMIATASEEDVQMLQKKYYMHCMETMAPSEFEFISPVDLEPVKVESVEKMKLIISESSMIGGSSKVKMDYYFAGVHTKNSQENENAAFAA